MEEVVGDGQKDMVELGPKAFVFRYSEISYAQNRSKLTIILS